MAGEIGEEDLKRWQNSTTDSFVSDLSRVNDGLEERSTFGRITAEWRHRIRDIFCGRFLESAKLRQQMLRFLRILARDKNNLDELLSVDLVGNVLSASLLVCNPSFEFDWEALVQAEMCLINLLFNSSLAREQFTEVSSSLLLSRIRLLCVTSPSAQIADHLPITLEKISFSEKSEFHTPQFLPMEALDSEQADLIAFYDLRIAFVASAHSRTLQSQWRNSGCDVFLKVLERSLQFPDKLRIGLLKSAETKHFVEYTNWTLKILFNIFCYASVKDVVKEWARHCVLLCSRVVTLQNVDPSLEQSAVDVIAVIPLSIEFLVTKLQPEEESGAKGVYCGCDITFADTVLRALERRLEGDDDEETELLSTFLTVLIRLCSEVKVARRYLRLRVIPPLHAMDVERRPDEGAALRNRLIRLMMSISSSGDLAAEFVFILCKKSVNRFVKYCGFGHAAGLLANRGILGSLNAPKHPSDSEDSETEDYKAVEAQVNPVTGCIEPPKEDPFAGMTEEQKEYEVHRLMNDISKLMNQGVITPGQIGEDGRVRPVRHVLELVKDAKAKADENGSDSNVD